MTPLIFLFQVNREDSVTSKIHLGSISPGYIDHLDELVVSGQAVHVKGP